MYVFICLKHFNLIFLPKQGPEGSKQLKNIKTQLEKYNTYRKQ